MFEGEQYASYIALCRELRLEHHITVGDWYASWEPGAPSQIDIACQPKDKPTFDVPSNDFEWQEVWLPRLDQWMAMLEEAGLPDVFFVPRWAAGQFQVWREGQKTMTGPCGEGPTREEAAARLYLALTGRTVTSG